MKITTLVENHPNNDQPTLKAEHGVSFYIEIDEHVYMSDVGQSDKFAENAALLGKDLAAVEALAISHYHYDHGGGLRRFLKVNQRAKVFLRACPPELDYIAEDPGDTVRYIGLDKGLLQEYNHRISYIAKNHAVLPGFYLLTDIPETFPKPSGDQRLKMKTGSHADPDKFEHEMVMVLEGEQGLVILTGCAHNGVLNMIEATRQALPDESIQAVIGGFHLHHEDEDTIREIGKAMLAWNIPHIITGHCTGEEAIDILAGVLGERLIHLHTGLVMEF